MLSVHEGRLIGDFRDLCLLNLGMGEDLGVSCEVGFSVGGGVIYFVF